MLKTIKSVRESFWCEHPEYKSFYRVNKRQNNYICDIRAAFVDYVDFLQKSGQITEKLAYKVTL